MIEHIYDALLDDEALDALPARLAEMVGARSATFQTVVGETPVHVAAHYFSEEMGAYYLANDIVALDPWTPQVVQRGLVNRAVSADDFMTRDTFKRTAFFNEFFRRFGDDTGVSLGGIITTRDGYVGLGLHRPLGGAEYDLAERAALDAVLPHLRRLAEARARLGLLEGRIRDMETLLSSQAAPVIMTNGGGRILFANAAGIDLLSEMDGVSSNLGVLRAAGPSGARLEAALARAAGAKPTGDAILAPRPSGKPPLRIVVAPHRGLKATPGRVMVLIEDPSTTDPTLGDRLRRLFGLSAAEAELAVLLADGRSMAEIADARRVLSSTARSQLNAVLAKTGARRQSDLMALIARLPRLR